MASPIRGQQPPQQDPMLTLDDEAYRRMVDQQQKFYDRAMDDSVLREGFDMVRSGQREVTGDEIEGRMNPYLEQVLGRTRDDINTQNRINAARRAAGRGGMRGFGSRGALGEAVARDMEEERLASTMAQQRFQGFETARNQVNTERNRDIQAGQTLGSLDINNRSMMSSAGGTLGQLSQGMLRLGQDERSLVNQFENDALNRERQRIAMLTSMGGQQQTQMQGGIDSSMGLFSSIQQYPYGQLGFGNQMLPGAAGSTQVQDTGRNIFGQIVGTAATVAGLGLPTKADGSGGGTLGASLLGFKRGGRVGALRMANGGQVPSVEDAFPNPFATVPDGELRAMQLEAEEMGQPELAARIQKERLAREAKYATPIPLTPRGAPGTAMEYPVTSSMETDPPYLPVDEYGYVAPRPEPKMARPPKQPPARPGALTMASPAPAAAQEEVEEPSVLSGLWEGWNTVDPLTGTSPLYDFGVNMLMASSSPEPGRGFLGNVGVALKSMDKEKAARRSEARQQEIDAVKAQAQYKKALADLKDKPLSSIGKIQSDRMRLVEQFGADSAQVAEFDRLLQEEAKSDGISLEVDPETGKVSFRQGSSVEDDLIKDTFGPGLQRNEQGQLQWIMGSQGQRAAQEELLGLKEKRRRIARTIENVIDRLERSGLASGRFSNTSLANIASQDAVDVRELLKQVEAQLAFGELRALRQSGATLGQVTERELDLLKSLGGAISQQLNPQLLMQNLRDVLADMDASIGRLDQSYSSYLPQQPQGQGGAPARSGAPVVAPPVGKR